MLVGPEHPIDDHRRTDERLDNGHDGHDGTGSHVDLPAAADARAGRSRLRDGPGGDAAHRWFDDDRRRGGGRDDAVRDVLTR